MTRIKNDIDEATFISSKNVRKNVLHVYTMDFNKMLIFSL